jgi:hypothetical protein
MSHHPIPPASLERIRMAYANFEQITQVVAEAMGLDVKQQYRIDLQGGAFVIGEDAPELMGAKELEPANGRAPEPTSPAF